VRIRTSSPPARIQKMKPKGLPLLLLLTLVLLTFVEPKVVHGGIQEAIGNVTHPMTGSSELRRSPAVRQSLGSIAFCDGNRRAWLPRSTDAAPSAMFPVTFSNVNSNLAAFIDLTANYVPLPELPPKVYLLFSVPLFAGMALIGVGYGVDRK
jgi:hypothetical protein